MLKDPPTTNHCTLNASYHLKVHYISLPVVVSKTKLRIMGSDSI